MDHTELQVCAVGMQALPDEVLQMVFTMLPTDSLLQARAVCRRWRSLALDPSVWAHRDLVCDWDHRTELVALRVAPRLRSLYIHELFAKESPHSVLKAALYTECTVRELSICFNATIDDRDCIWPDPSPRSRSLRRVVLEQVLRRQVELGEGAREGVLRNVELAHVDPIQAVSLVEIALRAHLDELHVGVDETTDSGTSNLSAEAAAGNASLKSLSYESCYYPSISDLVPPMLQTLLRAHAATLESLAVPYGLLSCDERLLIATCPQLQRLELAANKSLATLFDSEQVTNLQQKTHLFCENPYRNATQLRRLSLPRPYRNYVSRIGNPLSKLRALTELQISNLEELALGGILDLSWNELLRVLAGLPRLRSLYIWAVTPTDDPLEVIGTAVPPNLQVLRVETPCDKRSGRVRHSRDPGNARQCGLPELHSLLRRNPQLHVVGLPSPHPCSKEYMPDELECGCCEHGLHPPHPEPEYSAHYSLCGHGEAEQCGLEAHRVRPEKCPCSPTCQLPHTWLHVS